MSSEGVSLLRRFLSAPDLNRRSRYAHIPVPQSLPFLPLSRPLARASALAALTAGAGAAHSTP
jgi:hypothetical protein